MHHTQTAIVLHIVTHAKSSPSLKTGSKRSKRRDPHQSDNIAKQTIKQIYHYKPRLTTTSSMTKKQAGRIFWRETCISRAYFPANFVAVYYRI